MEAHVLSLNNFNTPRIFKGETAEAIHIIYLILLDKGKFQSHPDMGVGLRTEYRWKDDENVLFAVQTEIERQINTYLPDITLNDIQLTLTGDHVLGIVIVANNNAYVMAYNTDNGEFQFGQDADYVLQNF